MSSTPLRFALLGHPVGHSISPAIHRAAYESLGLLHAYELLDVPDESAVRRRFEELRRGRFAGFNVTVPWKRLALELADQVDDSAHDVGAANVLVRHESGLLEAHNTDVVALADEIAARSARVTSVAIIGNGGAALAALAAARRLGARAIWVTARSFRAEALEREWSHVDQFTSRGASVLPWPGRADAARIWKERLAQSQVIVQATSAGMHGAAAGDSVADLVPWAELDKTVLAYDVVYNPALTPFLERAREVGLNACGGLGMLVGQAARAFELWLGQTPPRDRMQRAAEHALAAKARP